MNNGISDIKVRKLRVGDATLLRQEKILCGTGAEVTDIVRKLTEGGSDAYTAIRPDDSIAALCVVKTDGVADTSASLRIYTEQNGVVMPSDNDMIRILDAVLYKSFIKRGIYRISIVLDVTDTVTENILLSMGFVQEAVLHSYFRDGKSYDDAALFYILAPAFKGYNVCFVPFQRGILAVYGGEDHVSKVEFHHYGTAPENVFASDCADYLGILDDEGKFRKRGAPEYEYGADDISFLPGELIKAFIELKEYFAKQREAFDINIRPTKHATDFQRRVWDVLVTIPYGATYSYEDVALELTEGNVKEARKMTRAVGAACSDNPVPVLVPCHRVIGKDGMLVGYTGGVEFKDFLLQQEAFPAPIL